VGVLEDEVAKVKKDLLDREEVYVVFLPRDLVIPLVLTVDSVDLGFAKQIVVRYCYKRDLILRP
jgi:hypothetical protein